MQHEPVAPGRRLALCGGAALLAAPALPWAQGAPAQDLALLVGYSAGGSVDLVARTLAPALSRELGQAVRVENLAGASGALAAVKTALAAPDGRTLLMGSPSEVGINHLLRRDGRFDPRRDLTPIGLVGSQPLVLVAGRSVPVADIDQFLTYAARRGSRARYASAGAGTPLHLAGEAIQQRAGITLEHRPYRGAGPMLPDLLDGRVEFAVMVLSSALAMVREGRLRALGVTTAARAPGAPDIPALAEHPRLQGLDIGVWFGLFGPARLQASTVQQLRLALLSSLKVAAVRQRLEGAGVSLMEETPIEPFLLAELQKFERLVAWAGLRG